jgi:type I restriction enzyme R subunit
MSRFDVIAETEYNTVVAEYTPDAKKYEAYQSETTLEAEFIRLLSTQGYGMPKITSESELIAL